MQEPELPARSRERTAGRRDGDHSSLMWCLWLERRVCPHLGGQRGVPTHPSPNSAPSGLEARPDLPTPGSLALPSSSASCPPEFCKTPNAAAEAQSRRTHLQTSFLGLVTHQPSLLAVTRDSVSLCWSTTAPPLINEQDHGPAAHPTSKGQPDPCYRHMSDASPHSIFGPDSTFSCNEHPPLIPLADDRSPRRSCSRVTAALWVCLQG